MLTFHSVTSRPLRWTLIHYTQNKMRLTSTSKILLLCILSLALISIFQNYKNLHKDWRILKVLSDKNKEKTDFKYILQWTSPKNIPFVDMGQGRDGFITRKCQYTNCIVTSNSSLLGDYTKFDVIAFAGPEVVAMGNHMLPKFRSPHQKYVFASIESSHNYPVCSNRFDGYFNWTWTYKLDSEVRWGYIVIRDSNGDIIGPNKDMNWIDWEDMEPIGEAERKMLSGKTKAAAWFVSNCFSKSRREVYVAQLKKELLKYNLELDIYGACTNLKCSRDNEAKCNIMVARDYYFYLSFENAFSEDYVTEKLLIAVQNSAVPIVYGGANYSRFLPNGSYLDAKELGVEKLAMKMYDLINNIDEYAEYFRWRNHYSYYKTPESVITDEYCRFCELLNNKDMMSMTSVYNDFSKWWDPVNYC